MVAHLDLTGTPPPASRTLVPLYFAHAILHILIGIYPAVLLTLRTTFDADYATLGAVFTAATFLYGAGSIPTGFLVNRIHPLTIVRGYLALAAVAALVVAAAPGETLFALGLLLLGLAGSPYHAAAMTLISRASGNDPRLLAHHGMAGSLGLAAAPAFAALLAAAVSWRLPFAVAGGLSAAVLLSTLAVPRLENPTALAGGEPAPRTHVSHGATHLGALALVYLITIALGFVFRGVVTFLPALAAERADVLPGTAMVAGGLLAALVYLAGFFGQWWAGRLGHRPGLERTYTLLLAAQAVLLAAVAVTVDWALVMVLLVFSVIHFTTQPLDNVLTGKYTSLSRRGVGYGFSFGLSFGFGSFAAWAGGAVADAAGGRLQWVYVMLAGVALFAALAGAALWLVARRLTAPANVAAGPEPVAVGGDGTRSAAGSGLSDAGPAADRPFPDAE